MRFCIFSEDGHWHASIYANRVERTKDGAWHLYLGDEYIAGAYSGDVVLQAADEQDIEEVWKAFKEKQKVNA